MNRWKKLYLICQRYKLESESQHIELNTNAGAAVFNMSKIQTWKRITTVANDYRFVDQLYLICQRYKLESESQRMVFWHFSSIAVFNMSKIQTWKRITTSISMLELMTKLYLICQRYKLESESQHDVGTEPSVVSCI